MPCSGDTPPCEGYGEADCEFCGCEWDWERERCTGEFPDPCNSYDDQLDCEDCGCVWGVPGIANAKLNVGDVFKGVLEMKINFGGAWKTVTEIKQNIGDVWKSVY